MRSIRFLAALAIGSVAAQASAATIQVPSQFSTIQAAINASVNGDVIVVAPGTYAEAITFGGKRVHLRSSDGAAATTINAQSLGNAVVRFENAENNQAIIEGFTLRGGTGKPGAVTRGGGIFISAATPIIRSCIIRNNTAGQGGGIYVTDAPSGVQIQNTIIAVNSANFGGGLYCVISNPSVKNCTIVSNSAGEALVGTQGGGWYNGSFATGQCINSIVWGNSPAGFGGSANPVTRYSNVQDAIAGTGNISANPLFVNSGAQNYRLQPGSPCIDAGDSSEVASVLFKDIEGGQRGVDDPAKVDTGVAVFGLVVDMGAYERQVAVQSSCPGDLSGDGTVGFDDLLQLLSLWGNCP